MFISYLHYLCHNDYIIYSYKIYDVKANTFTQQVALRAVGNSGEFDFWGPSRVMVKPEQIQRFEELMKSGGIEFTVFVDDVDE